MTGPFAGLLNTLYPGGSYGDMVDPQQLREEQMLALRRAGLSLLANSGPKPVGTRNFGADLAQALDPGVWQNRMAQVAEQSATISAMQRKARAEATAQAIMGQPQFQPKPGESDQQRDARLGALVDAFQQAGLMEQAKAAADLRSQVRAPNLTERNGILYDHWGNPVAMAPGAEGGIDGSQLVTSAEKQIAQFDPVHKALLLLNRTRNIAPTEGKKLDQTTSSTFVDAAKAILSTHSSLAEDEDNPLKTLAHAHAAGDLGRFLAALLTSGGGRITTAQRDEVLRLIDPVLQDIQAEQVRVRKDIERRFHSRWSKDPEMAQRMLDQLPVLPDITPGARLNTGISPDRMNQMKRIVGRPND